MRNSPTIFIVPTGIGCEVGGKEVEDDLYNDQFGKYQK